MDLTRRELLGGAGAATGALLSGCTAVPEMPNPLAGGSRTPTPMPTSARSTPAATPTPTPTPAGNATGTGTPAPPADPGAATRAAIVELGWFVESYSEATAEFLSLTGRVRSLCDSLARQSSVGEADLRKLRGLAGRVRALVVDRLGPHFDTEPELIEFTTDRLDRLARVRERGDWDRLSSLLAGLAERYAAVSGESYVARTFPTDPVDGRLLRRLSGPGHADDAGFVAYHAGSERVVRARRRPVDDAGGLAGGREAVAGYRRRYGPLGDRTGRTGLFYLTLTDLATRAAPVSALVQRYRDADRAGVAVERLLDGPVSPEGRVSFGGRRWRRVFYYADGDVVYADLVRLGAFVVAVGATTTPWDERPAGWTRPIELSWLWEGAA
jgi:hypothetical protein